MNSMQVRSVYFYGSEWCAATEVEVAIRAKGVTALMLDFKEQGSHALPYKHLKFEQNQNRSIQGPETTNTEKSSVQKE